MQRKDSRFVTNNPIVVLQVIALNSTIPSYIKFTEISPYPESCILRYLEEQKF